jgi:hypothetical protein
MLDVGPDIQPRAVICDKSYASKATRKRRIAPSFPQSQQKRRAGFLRPHALRGRARIEQGVGQLEDDRAATRR